MLIEMIAVRAMEVPVMQIISMIAVTNGRMAAALPMQVGVPFMEFMMIPQWNAFYNKGNTRHAGKKVK